MGHGPARRCPGLPEPAGRPGSGWARAGSLPRLADRILQRARLWTTTHGLGWHPGSQPRARPARAGKHHDVRQPLVAREDLAARPARGRGSELLPGSSSPHGGTAPSCGGRRLLRALQRGVVGNLRGTHPGAGVPGRSPLAAVQALPSVRRPEPPGAGSPVGGGRGPGARRPRLVLPRGRSRRGCGRGGRPPDPSSRNEASARSRPRRPRPPDGGSSPFPSRLRCPAERGGRALRSRGPRLLRRPCPTVAGSRSGFVADRVLLPSCRCPCPWLRVPTLRQAGLPRRHRQHPLDLSGVVGGGGLSASRTLQPGRLPRRGGVRVRAPGRSGSGRPAEKGGTRLVRPPTARGGGHGAGGRRGAGGTGDPSGDGLLVRGQGRPHHACLRDRRGAGGHGLPRALVGSA